MENAGQTPLDAAQYIGTPGQLSPPAVPAPSTPSTPRQPGIGQQQSQQPGNQRGPASLPPPGSAPPYSASYNANGEMVCRSRSTTPSASCWNGNDGGAQLSYDAEGQLVHWQNAPGTSPTSTVNTLYDGEGNRVEQQVGQYSCGQACGTTYTTTQYVAGGIEEVAQTGGTTPSTTTTKYYSAGGLLVGERVNGTMSYLASDGLGSVSAALSSSGSLTAAQLFAPYGGVRFSSGTMPTARGYTGQYADAATGLDYFKARYYDPIAGQFTTADSVKGGQGPNRYAYVLGNPETRTDPTGQTVSCPPPGGCGGGGGGCTSDSTCGCYTSCGNPTVPHHDPGKYTCQASGRICREIVDVFHNALTVNLLFLLTYSSLGLRFLQFLIDAGANFGGDTYISWVSSGATQVDYTGKIQLNYSILNVADKGDPNAADINWVSAAGGLIHEAVESYYALADGIDSQASQHMDYVAEWFAGDEREQLGLKFQLGSIPGGSAFHQTFSTWMSPGNDGQNYTGEHPDQPELSFPGNIGAFFASQPGFSNGMGLTTDMLTSGCVGVDSACY